LSSEKNGFQSLPFEFDLRRYSVEMHTPFAEFKRQVAAKLGVPLVGLYTL
jgi:hypothetical protein